MKIYLVRHGETDWTRQQRLQGRRDIPLNEEGIRQMVQTGKRLAEMGITADIMLSSPLSRAGKSAELIAGEIGYPADRIVTEPLFIERDFGKGEGVVIDDLGHKFPDDSFADMESMEALCRRAHKAVRKVTEEYPEQTVMVVAHGAILKAVLAEVSQGKIVYQDQTVRIAPGSVYCLEFTDGKFGITSLGQ